MAYNNGFPINYPQVQPIMYPQGSIQPQNGLQSQQPNNSSIIWVQGETGAKSYLVAPNNTVALWDSENPTIYLKSADASGMPNIRVLDYTFRDTVQNKSPIEKATEPYATKQDIADINERIDEIKAKLETPAKTSGRKKATDDDE